MNTNDRSWFKQCLVNKDLVAKLKNIAVIVADVDGALTNAQVYLPKDTEEIKGFSVQDGFMMSYAHQTQVLEIAFVSGRSSSALAARAQQLGIARELCILGVPFNGKVSMKEEAIERVKRYTKADISTMLMYGDEIIDGALKSHVALFVAPSNAPFYVQRRADLILPRDGGNHAFRLLLDLILYIKGKHCVQDWIAQALDNPADV